MLYSVQCTVRYGIHHQAFTLQAANVALPPATGIIPQSHNPLIPIKIKVQTLERPLSFIHRRLVLVTLVAILDILLDYLQRNIL